MKLSSLATAGLTTSILSILAGAIVRATGSGDGCGASWPTCNGRVIPSLETSSEIIEFSHRSISGVLLIVTLLLFVKSKDPDTSLLHKKIINYLTFFVLLEAAIGAVIVIYEWVGLNSSLPRIIAVPLHLVNTFALLGFYTLIFYLLRESENKLSNFFDKRIKIAFVLFFLTGATGSITALADVLFPSASFVEGFIEDFDSTSEVLTRLRILHPFVSTILSIFLFSESNRFKKEFAIDTSIIKVLVIVGVILGVLNVVSNIILPLSILHLLLADLLWITYVYKSVEKATLLKIPQNID
ncbi:COX15/CtaA family protein [Acidimicrobiaceae bacterium]|nr:COX15/CtaA family protein [Acidimicrobiaceae bacterium]